jgi:F-type H+-transporting ATPase subunit delta
MDAPDRSRTRPPSVLEDPSAQQIARVYADAFLRAAQSAGAQGLLDEYESFLENVLERHPEFASLLSSGVLTRDEKLAMIDRVVAPRGSASFTNFLRVLARHDRLGLLPIIFRESVKRHEEQAGRRRVQVTSARELSQSAREQIRQRLVESFPFEPILETSVDQSLLGGLVIRIGDTVYDTSLRTRLRQLRGRLLQRSLHEIQSGRDRFSHPEGD